MAKEMTLEDIQQLTEDFADARNAMMAAGDALNVDMEATKQAHLPTLTAAARVATTRMTTLFDAVKANEHLFKIKGQKTKIWAGIKVGLNSGKAKVVSVNSGEIDAKALYELAVVVREDADALVKVEYSVRQAGLNALPDDALPMLSLKRNPAGDSPIVKPIDEDAAKIVDRLIKEFVADDAE